MSKTHRPEAYTSLQAGIGKRIAWARELVGLSQSELAGMLEVDQSTLNKIERGDRAPNIFYVIGIANRLRVSTDYILRGLLHARSDAEMALKLAALHPDLVLRSARTDQDKDTGHDGGRPDPTTTRTSAMTMGLVSLLDTFS